MTRSNIAKSAKSAGSRTAEAPARPASRPPVAVDPDFVTLDHEGYGWRRWMVRLPEDAIADDLKEPSLWARVQKQRLSLRRHDHLYIVAYDESWAAEAIVTDATAEAAAISKPRILSFGPRLDRLFDDGTYRVKWYGNGFAVERAADGQRLTDPVASQALAERDLARLYPKRG